MEGMKNAEGASLPRCAQAVNFEVLFGTLTKARHIQVSFLSPCAPGPQGPGYLITSLVNEANKLIPLPLDPFTGLFGKQPGP
jgi:hypothetical protein